MKFIVTIEETVTRIIEVEMEGNSIMEVYDQVQINLNKFNKVSTKKQYIKKINKKDSESNE
jgi:hypothetical protein